MRLTGGRGVCFTRSRDLRDFFGMDRFWCWGLDLGMRAGVFCIFCIFRTIPWGRRGADRFFHESFLGCFRLASSEFGNIVALLPLAPRICCYGEISPGPPPVRQYDMSKDALEAEMSIAISSIGHSFNFFGGDMRNWMGQARATQRHVSNECSRHSLRETKSTISGPQP